MSGRRRKKARSGGQGPWYESGWLSGLLLVAVGAYFALSLTGGSGHWWRVLEGGSSAPWSAPGNPGGPVGAAVAFGLRLILGGVWCWAMPAFLVAFGLGFIAGRPRFPAPWLLRALPLWLVTASFLAQPGFLAHPNGLILGGAVGYWLAVGFQHLVGTGGMRLFLGVFMLVAVIVVLRPWLGWLPGVLERLGEAMGPVGPAIGRILAWPVRRLGAALAALWQALVGLASWRPAPRAERDEDERDDADDDGDLRDEAAVPAAVRRRERVVHQEPANDTPAPAPAVDPVEIHELPGAAGAFHGDEELPDDDEAPRTAPRRKVRKAAGPVVLPTLELLTPAGPEGQPVAPAELDMAADLLESTLRSFGVEGEVKDVRPGPVVTTFEYQPGPGIRVSQIVQRTDDLALAMRARSIRMEAPIPGKAAVGIEIPNPKARMVRLREVLEL
ncbi:MAG TPA: DNA translocase FtsK, partial [Candidatus Krumholzibacteria bacterium]|nr:DNA translocase FtsK [Candidatus Krumholzibacteria bacterium]